MKNEVNIPVLKKLVEDLYSVTVDMTTKRKHTLVGSIPSSFLHRDLHFEGLFLTVSVFFCCWSLLICLSHLLSQYNVLISVCV